ARLVYASDAAITMTGVTVAICTYQRPESLKRFLETLTQQDRQPDKIMIVDASLDDATESMLCQHPNIAQLADRLLYIRVSGRRKGITRQRNCALRQATTDLIAFFDD